MGFQPSTVAPENRPGPNRKGSSPNHPFSGAFAVSFREGKFFLCAEANSVVDLYQNSFWIQALEDFGTTLCVIF